MSQTAPVAERVIHLELTETECNEIVQLIDVAVKAAGLPAAKVATKFFDRIGTELRGAIVPASVVPPVPPHVLKR